MLGQGWRMAIIRQGAFWYMEVEVAQTATVSNTEKQKTEPLARFF
ncbi:hypothetical protein [Pseudomonas viridiflava]|nr:hypothetical protein [Pseudomonas viridiflava]